MAGRNNRLQASKRFRLNRKLMRSACLQSVQRFDCSKVAIVKKKGDYYAE